jgi:hypothetical protein
VSRRKRQGDDPYARDAKVGLWSSGARVRMVDANGQPVAPAPLAPLDMECVWPEGWSQLPDGTVVAPPEYRESYRLPPDRASGKDYDR